MSRVIVVIAIVAVAAFLLSHVPAMPNFSSFNWPGNGVTAESNNTYHFPAQGTLQISDASGDIQITGTDSNTDTIDVRVTKHASNTSEVEQLTSRIGSTGSGVVIESVYPHMCIDCDISYSIRLPRSARVQVDDESGDVRVRGTTDLVTIKAASGDVHLDDVSGAVSADMDSGDATLTNVTSAVRVIDQSGSIEAHGLANSVDFGTSSGDITAEFARFENVRTVHVQTSSGSIKFVAPKGFGARISATTSSGSMDSNMDLPIHEGDSGADVAVAVGSGTATVQLSTDSGDVTINQQ